MHVCSLIRAFAPPLNILWQLTDKLLTEQHLEFLSLKWGCSSTLAHPSVFMSKCHIVGNLMSRLKSFFFLARFFLLKAKSSNNDESPIFYEIMLLFFHFIGVFTACQIKTHLGVITLSNMKGWMKLVLTDVSFMKEQVSSVLRHQLQKNL